MGRDISEDQVRDLVRAHLETGGAELSVRRIPTGKFNESFRVSWTAGDKRRERVVRIAPPTPEVPAGERPGAVGFLFYEYKMMRGEPGVHRLLRERTAVPVPEIEVSDESLDLISRPFLIMETLPGRPLTEAPLAGRAVNEVFHQIGCHLAEVHAIHGEAHGYSGPHRRMEPQRDWLSAFRMMWDFLVADIEAAGFYSKDEGAAMRGLLDKNLGAFDREVPPSLLHMDVWHQNILVDDNGKVTGLLDWDRHLWGDPEIEFAVLDYCGVSEPAFWAGYGREREESAEARVRHLFYYLYEHQKYIVIRGKRNGLPEQARQYKDAVMRMVRGKGGAEC